MNSELGDLHHQREFHWVKRIRCAKNIILGTAAVMPGNSGTFPCTGDSSEARRTHRQVPTKPSIALPCLHARTSLLSQNPSNPNTAGLHTRTQKKIKLKFTTMLIGFDVPTCRNTQRSHKTRAEPPCTFPGPQKWQWHLLAAAAWTETSWPDQAVLENWILHKHLLDVLRIFFFFF